MSISVTSSAGFSSMPTIMPHRTANRPGFQPRNMDGTPPNNTPPNAQAPGQQLSAALHEQLMRWRTEFGR